MSAYLDLDFVCEATTDAEALRDVRQWLRERVDSGDGDTDLIELEVLDLRGAGGGWPHMRFRAVSAQRLAAVAFAYVADSDGGVDDFDHLMNAIVTP